MHRTSYDLENRLIDFTVLILDLSEKLPNTFGAITLNKQIMRSGTSPALNYGEAQSAESPRDFLHKLKICLKEMRETQISLKTIRRKAYCAIEYVDRVLNECNELVAIFQTSVQTKKRNMSK